MTSGHLGPAVLAEYDEGLLADGRAAQVRAHLAECDACSALHAQIGALPERLRTAPKGLPVPGHVVQQIEEALAAERERTAESAQALIRTLFGLESTWPPYHDDLAAALPAIEEAQGWPTGYLPMALTRLMGDGDPSFQQELEDRVERLLRSRSIEHEWGNDLEPLKALRFAGDV